MVSPIQSSASTIVQPLTSFGLVGHSKPARFLRGLPRLTRDEIFIEPELRSINPRPGEDPLPASGTTWFRHRQSASRVVIAGEPGSGKTTLVNWLNIPTNAESWFGHVPVIGVRAIEWDTKRTRLDSWAANPSEEATIETRGPRAWLIVDGLGDLRDGNERNRLTKEISAWGEKHAGLGLVIVLRTTDWDWARYAFGDYFPLELEPFTRSKSEELISAWLMWDGHLQADAKKTATDLMNQLWARPTFRRFISVPYYVYGALRLFQAGLPLPINRQELMLSLQRLDYGGLYRDSPPQGDNIMAGELDHAELLSRLAWEALESEKCVISEQAVEEIWHQHAAAGFWFSSQGEGARWLTRALESGILKLSPNGGVEFPLRIQTEWLASRFLYNIYEDEDQHQFDLLCEKLLGPGQADSGQLAWFEWLSGWLNGTKAERLLTPLAQSSGQGGEIHIFTAARALAEVRTRGVCTEVDTYLRSRIQEIAETALDPVSSTQTSTRKLPGTACILWQPSRIRNEAVKLRTTLWPEGHETHTWLMRILKNTEQAPETRSLALETYTRYYPAMAEKHQILNNSLNQDPDPLVRRTALLLLTGSSPVLTEKAAELVKERAVTDKAEKVRGQALRQLASAFRKPETVVFLAKVGSTDTAPLVRRAAYESALDYYKDYPATIEFVAERAMEDGDLMIRRETIDALTARFPDHPLTRNALIDRCESDDSYALRSLCFDYLANRHGDETFFGELMRARAQNEPVNILRQKAIAKVCASTAQSPELLVFLNQRLTTEKDISTMVFLRQCMANERCG